MNTAERIAKRLVAMEILTEDDARGVSLRRTRADRWDTAGGEWAWSLSTDDGRDVMPGGHFIGSSHPAGELVRCPDWTVRRDGFELDISPKESNDIGTFPVTEYLHLGSEIALVRSPTG